MVQVIYACCILHIANANDMDIFEPLLDNAYPDPVLAQYVQLEYKQEERVQDNTGQIVRDEICQQLATRL